MQRIAALPCAVCGVIPVTLHHVTASAYGGRTSRSHKRVVPLCPRHHLVQFGPLESVEAIGHRGFYLMHGIDLLALADGLWRETLAMEGDVGPAHTVGLTEEKDHRDRPNGSYVEED